MTESGEINDWRVVKRALDAEIEAVRFEAPPDVLLLMKYGYSPHGAGTDGQCFTTWVFVAGDIRYLAFYGAANIVALSRREEFTAEHLKTMARQYISLSATFLGYCGLDTFWSLTGRFLSALEMIEAKGDLVDMLDSYAILCSMYNQWIQHYFPWGIGYAFPAMTDENLDGLARLRKPRGIQSPRS